MVKLLALLTARCLMLARCCGLCCITIPRRLPGLYLSRLLTATTVTPMCLTGPGFPGLPWRKAGEQNGRACSICSRNNMSTSISTLSCAFS